MDSVEFAKNVIKNNNFLSIATSFNNQTWIAPVFFAVDDKYNFYFVSSIDSTHVQHILQNKQVALSIFDSVQPEGDANGVQIKGEAIKIPISKYPDVLKLFWEKTRKKVITEDEIQQKINEYENNKRSIFQIVPKEIYVQDQEYFKKYRIDKRVRIDL